MDRFKRLGQPPAVPRYSQVVLSDFLQSVAELTQPRWKSDASRNGKSVHLQWHATDQLRVEIDESAMRSVLTNLVFNAVDAIPQQGQIEIRAEAAGDHAVISVADDGQGMTDDQVTRCLEPFVTFRPDGCGIGLTMCQQIIAQHNGQIEIASKPGRGTEVKITLPLTCPPRSDVPKSTDGHQGRRVLLVDDDESVRESICALLAVKGLKTDAVADRDQAIARLETSQYDVVISDLTLKNMRGDQLLQECRQRWPQVRRVLISGWSDEAKDDVSSGSDAEMRLAKPFNADDLLQRLAKLDDQVG
ncbi:MAG: response regulator [Pirellulaceae bacterium]|nr:response regulator [Pirellulaceae bacterium]